MIQTLKWPTISDIIETETATTIYKSLDGLAPEYLSKMFVKNSTRTIRQLRNTETDLYFLSKTSDGQKVYPFVDQNSWNQLQYDRKQAPFLATFKQRLKANL